MLRHIFFPLNIIFVTLYSLNCNQTLKQKENRALRWEYWTMNRNACRFSKIVPKANVTGSNYWFMNDVHNNAKNNTNMSLAYLLLSTSVSKYEWKTYLYYALQTGLSKYLFWYQRYTFFNCWFWKAPKVSLKILRFVTVLHIRS